MKPSGVCLMCFAIGPPAEIVDLFDVLVRAVQQGNVVFQELPGRGVGDVLVKLVVVLVECIDIVPEGFGLEHERLGRRRRFWGGADASTEAGRLGKNSAEKG